MPILTNRGDYLSIHAKHNTLLKVFGLLVCWINKSVELINSSFNIMNRPFSIKDTSPNPIYYFSAPSILQRSITDQSGALYFAVSWIALSEFWHIGGPDWADADDCYSHRRNNRKVAFSISTMFVWWLWAISYCRWVEVLHNHQAARLETDHASWMKGRSWRGRTGGLISDNRSSSKQPSHRALQLQYVWWSPVSCILDTQRR